MKDNLASMVTGAQMVNGWFFFSSLTVIHFFLPNLTSQITGGDPVLSFSLNF